MVYKCFVLGFVYSGDGLFDGCDWFYFVDYEDWYDKVGCDGLFCVK